MDMSDNMEKIYLRRQPLSTGSHCPHPVQFVLQSPISHLFLEQQGTASTQAQAAGSR